MQADYSEICRFVTFYSFKGGVGRTLAMVNVAAELAKTGRRVVLIDFDLEAPGLNDILDFSIPSRQKGVVDLVYEGIASGSTPDVQKYVYEPKKLNEKFSHGRLWIMPAGDRSNKDRYYQRFTNINWVDLYERQNGYLFFQDVKEGIVREFRPHYVLIDSRTGFTDHGGICTTHLPDIVVLMYYPDRQNLVGIERAAKAIRASCRPDAQGRQSVELLFVASKVPDVEDEEGVLEKRLDEFRQRCESRDPRPPKIYYRPSLKLLEEELCVVHRPNTSLAKSFTRLKKRICDANPMDRDTLVDTLEKGARLRLRGGVPDEEPVVIAQQLSTWYGDDEVAVKAIAEYHLYGQKDFGKAEEFYRKLCELNPSSIEHRLGLSQAVEEQGRSDEARELVGGCQVSEDVEPTALVRLAHRLAEFGECELALSHVASFMERKGRIEDLAKCEAVLRDRYAGDFERAAELYLELANESDDAPKVVGYLDSALTAKLAGRDDGGAVVLAHRLRRNAAFGRGPWRHIHLFNVGYALREDAPEVSQECLKGCVTFMETEFPLDLMPNGPHKANFNQAMAYALRSLGRETDAITRLQRAIEVARSLEGDPRVFTFPQYRWLPRQEFLETACRQLEELKAEADSD